MHREAVPEAELVLLISHAFRECGEEVRIAGVQRYPVDSENDCKWDIGIFNGPRECAPIFRKIVEEFRSKYNLKTPDAD